MEKQLRSLLITDKLVKIAFVEADYIAGSSDNEEDDNDSVREHKHTCASPIQPHKDLTDSMKKLRKLALEALEINLAEAKDAYTFDVIGISIAGNVSMKKSRLKIKLGKNIKLTGKQCPIETGQITMYPDQEEKVKFPNADKISPIIEDIIEEVWEYLKGTKTGDEEGRQFALFPERDLQTA